MLYNIWTPFPTWSFYIQFYLTCLPLLSTVSLNFIHMLSGLLLEALSLGSPVDHPLGLDSRQAAFTRIMKCTIIGKPPSAHYRKSTDPLSFFYAVSNLQLESSGLSGFAGHSGELGVPFQVSSSSSLTWSMVPTRGFGSSALTDICCPAGCSPWTRESQTWLSDQTAAAFLC